MSIVTYVLLCMPVFSVSFHKNFLNTYWYKLLSLSWPGSVIWENKLIFCLFVFFCFIKLKKKDRNKDDGCIQLLEKYCFNILFQDKIRTVLSSGILCGGQFLLGLML